ncbi:zinc ribbon domain-containing protein [Variovorax saccharolyticus]|uniref:zinc ribbon domain-containing protein n=1 Tax=Variovorax saccharolyticus TaxID=3053516 RepID=UPI0025760D7D|nr:zinc ribbon domain-containing protein [Variovorax sp. J22R187]MDM0017089.1 hypothetical protein [Variovorax sp. J22R187]
MAELNLVFTVLCQHCGRPLYGRVKFCPSCGKEESISLVAGAASARRALERDPADQASPAGIQAPVAVAPAAVPRHEAQEAVATPAVSGAVRKLNEEADSAPARVAARIEPPTKEPAPPVAVLLTPEPAAVPAPVEMPEPVAVPAPVQMPTPVSVAAPVEIPTPTPIPAPTPMAPHGAVPKRPRIGKMAAMALLVLALVPASLYFSRQNEPATLPQLNEKLPQAQGTLDRGDPGATQRALATSAAALVPGQAPPAVEALGIADALPGLRDSPSPEPQETTCSQALAALGLCSIEPVAETGSEQIKP